MEGGLSQSWEVLSPSSGGCWFGVTPWPKPELSPDYTQEARSGCSWGPSGADGEERSPSSAWASAVFSCPTCPWARARSLSTSLSLLLRWRTWARQVSWEVKDRQD